MTMRHPAARATVCVCDVSKPTRDPTGTYDVRRRFKIATDLRWRKFAKLLRQTITSQDILGLGPEVSGALQLTFANLPAEARLRSLQSWTDDMLRRVVIEDGAAYLDPMASIGYNRAITRAQKLTGRKVVPEGAADAIGLLQHLAMTELQGIAEVASQQIVRVGSTAILERKTQAQAIREMNEVIERIGVVRSRAMVELIIVKAHATGTLDTFAAAGVKRVGLLPETRPGKKLTGDAAKPVAPAQGRRGTSASTIARIKRAEKEVEAALPEMVEVLTAGDDLVCEECEDIAADGPYDIDEARGLIPAHPHCRCSFVPEGSELFGVFSDDDWNEEDHPRDPGGEGGGQFASGGGGGVEMESDKPGTVAKVTDDKEATKTLAKYNKSAVTEDGAEKYVQKQMRNQDAWERNFGNKRGLDFYHESPGNQVASFKAEGIKSDYGTFSSVGKTSEYVSGERTIARFNLPREQLKSVGPDMIYHGHKKFGPNQMLLLSTKGKLTGGYVNTPASVPAKWISSITHKGSS